MALSISALITSASNFNLSESNNNESLTLSDSVSLSTNYTYGTGVSQVTNAVSLTGELTSGTSTIIDLYGINQSTFNSTQTIQFTGVKNFNVYNTSTSGGYDFLVRATGSDACTNLFNGGSGNLLVKPYSSFSYNDRYTGFEVNASNRYVQLYSDSTSGITYKLICLGLD
jgi:hypothetical protein